MKKILIFLMFLSTVFSYSQLGIGTTTPNASSIVDVTSTTKGLLLPRLTYAQRVAISSPTIGMVIYCSDCGANLGEMQTYTIDGWMNSAPSIASGTLPSTPTSPVATVGIGTASVAFTASASNGGGTNTYTVTSSPGGYTGTGTTSPIIVNVLPGTYTFTVTATNAVGNSTASTVSNSVVIATTPISEECKTPTTATVVVEITSTTGQIWMDRNLGALRAAVAPTDHFAYGCLYQWGRGNDGHASITWNSATSGTSVNAAISTLGTTDSPGPGFITSTVAPFDWRNPQKDALWSTSGATNNNPCPTGFRIPTEAELSAEITAYSITNVATAFSNGPDGGFKFTAAGARNYSTAAIAGVGTGCIIHTSTVSTTYARVYNVVSNGFFSNARSYGLSVRCIKG